MRYNFAIKLARYNLAIKLARYNLAIKLARYNLAIKLARYNLAIYLIIEKNLYINHHRIFYFNQQGIYFDLIIQGDCFVKGMIKSPQTLIYNSYIVGMRSDCVNLICF